MFERRDASAEGRESLLVVPVLREVLDVLTPPVETGRVRIRNMVHAHEEIVDPPLWRDEVVIERFPINRVIDEPTAARSEGDTLIIPVLEEVFVIEKRLLLKEEVRITKHQVETHRPQRVTLRREEAAVEGSTEEATTATFVYRSSMMAKTIIGYFAQVSEAQRVLQDLLDHGVDRDQISLIAHQERSGLELGGDWTPRAISVPGVGPMHATGPLAASLSTMTDDPAGSSLLDVLEDYGVSAADAKWYLEALHRGGVLVVVERDDAEADRVVDIINRARQSAKQARERADTAAEVSPTGEDVETIERSIDLDVPVNRTYEQWSRFEEFPQFMEGVEEVRRLDAKRLHWVATIGGTRKEWEAQITEDVPEQRIAWRSEAGEFTAGVVTFQPLGADRTRMIVRFEYEPQGVKETVGNWLGLVSRRVEHDLERFKAVVETRNREPAGQRTMAPTAE
jgi:uncharacterized protein (TIGR02271 family)